MAFELQTATWELLRHDNCPHENHLPGLLGRAPRTVGAIAILPGHDGAMPVDGTPA